MYTPQRNDLFAHQLQQNVFALRTDCRYAPKIDNQFPVLKICSGRLVGIFEFSGPRHDEFALNDHSTPAWVLDNRDLQHAARILDLGVRNARTKHLRQNYLVFQCKERDQPWTVVTVKGL